MRNKAKTDPVFAALRAYKAAARESKRACRAFAREEKKWFALCKKPAEPPRKWPAYIATSRRAYLTQDAEWRTLNKLASTQPRTKEGALALLNLVSKFDEVEKTTFYPRLCRSLAAALPKL